MSDMCVCVCVSMATWHRLLSTLPFSFSCLCDVSMLWGEGVAVESALVFAIVVTVLFTLKCLFAFSIVCPLMLNLPMSNFRDFL